MEEPTLAELEARVHRDDRESRSALLTIARDDLYLQVPDSERAFIASNTPFIAYATDKFGYSPQHTYRLLRVAAFEDALADHSESPIGDTTFPPMSHIRVLTEEAGSGLIKFGESSFPDYKLPIHAQLDPLIVPLALRVLAHDFKTADDVREALAPLIIEGRGTKQAQAQAATQVQATEDAQVVADAKESNRDATFWEWPNEAQEAWKRLQPTRTPKPRVLAERILSLARVLPVHGRPDDLPKYPLTEGLTGHEIEGLRQVVPFCLKFFRWVESELAWEEQDDAEAKQASQARAAEFNELLD